MQSLNIFMLRLLDYAGLFPPTTLSLQNSLMNFAEYRHHNQKDWLGKFILPVKKIDETISLLSNQNIFSSFGNKAQFSVILSNCETLSEFQSYLQNDLTSINRLIKKFGEFIDIQSFEILPPKEVFSSGKTNSMRDFLFDLSENFIENNIKADFYCELPFSENLDEYVTIIKRHNKNISKFQFSVKIRTGGVTPQQIPSSKEIINAILLFAEHKLPLKATAGLHVPVPNDNPHVGARLHGFLNIFSCLLLCYDEQKLNSQELEKIITTYSYPDFKFSETGLHVGDRFISNENMLKLRKHYIKSFGTCSFIEPIEHLHENHFIS